MLHAVVLPRSLDGHEYSTEEPHVDSRPLTKHKVTFTIMHNCKETARRELVHCQISRMMAVFKEFQ